MVLLRASFFALEQISAIKTIQASTDTPNDVRGSNDLALKI
jgi:hypothetical protein